MRLDIVTPERRVLDADVDSVTVPTASGEIGILPGHAPLISALRPGVLAYSIKGAASRLAVSGGFVEVNADKVAVLADRAESSEEIDVANARLEKEEAEKAMAAAATGPVDLTEQAREKLDASVARIQLASGK